MINKLETAKKIILEYYEDADCGLFNTRNLVGDPMYTIYDENGLQIDICYSYAYFEVFGLTNDEFDRLMKYYCSLGRR